MARMKKKSNQQACADAMTDSPPSPPSSDAAADEPAEIKRTRSSPHGGSPRVAFDDEKAAAARELRDDTPTTSDDAPSSPRKGFVKASELLAAEAEGDAGEVLEDDATKRADAGAAAAKEADSVFVVTLALAFALVWLCVRPMVKLGWLVARPFLEPVAKILTKPFGAFVA